MFVCVCRAVSDKTIRQAVNDGACSMRALCRETGIISQCGKCAAMAQQVLKDALQEMPAEAKVA
jgi:bacterioferritin-associated ferredoxin